MVYGCFINNTRINHYLRQIGKGYVFIASLFVFFLQHIHDHHLAYRIFIHLVCGGVWGGGGVGVVCGWAGVVVLVVIGSG